SIIQANNLCYTTLAREESALKARGLQPEKDYIKVQLEKTEVYYVKEHIQKSLLSVLLTDWLAKRAAIRATMKTANEEEKVILDKQQLAIKVTCNSVYGFTGVAHGYLPCLSIAASITSIGRTMLLKTRDFIHTSWATRENLCSSVSTLPLETVGPDYSMKVIYGDTDSVFVKCTGIDLDRLVQAGDCMAKVISESLFVRPVKLECEKTFSSLMLIAKKKYIGAIENKKMMMKGVDLIRKTNSSFVNGFAKKLIDCLFYN
ncbi:DNA-dependent DNA polymerase, partial [Iguanid herpesvirus 2]|uniref:DNA-dependent DNA polymerase n=1 Tax=Iguanid herpesvirus 2 TaxID=226584 RepID=UPI0000183DB4